MPLNAVILAAGEGTRMKSKHPKVVHEMLGKPLVWWSVNAARKAGAERIIVVIGSGADEVRAVFSDDTDVEFVEQSVRLGTGHAVRIVRDAIGSFEGPTVVLYGDGPLIQPETISRLVEHNKAGHFGCTLLTMTPPDPTGYGRILRDENGAPFAIVEQKDCTPEQAAITECNPGIYCFCGGRLTRYIDELTNDNAQGEYYLTDMLSILCEAGEPVSSLPVDFEETLGVNSRQQLAVAAKIMQDRINAHWMAEGVTMLAPDQVWIGPDVEIGRDTVIMPQTYLWGATIIGEDCMIGPNTRLTDCELADGVTVEETVGILAKIDHACTVGPRAYLRPGTHLLKGAHVGTHVEIKNSTIGEGSKVPHLSYIGDTTMGSGVNIGAGSITCNYDGVFKHRTTIGDNVFIGSDTMMVAPVSIGEGALVGASSCITSDVPAGALSLERSDQRVIEGYALKRMSRLRDEKAKQDKAKTE